MIEANFISKRDDSSEFFAISEEDERDIRELAKHKDVGQRVCCFNLSLHACWILTCDRSSQALHHQSMVTKTSKLHLLWPYLEASLKKLDKGTGFEVQAVLSIGLHNQLK